MTQRIAPDEPEDDEVEIYADGTKITEISITLAGETKTMEAPFTEAEARMVRFYTIGSPHDVDIRSCSQETPK